MKHDCSFNAANVCCRLAAALFTALIILLAMPPAMAAPHQCYSVCDNPNVCNVCGEPYEGETKHDYDMYNYVTDETHHWRACRGCGDKLKPVLNHHSYCTNPNVCEYCGAAFTNNNPMHRVDFSNYESDDTCHWPVCMDCGQGLKDFYEDHTASCADPVCTVCGAACAAVAEHVFDETAYISDADFHWRKCKNCDATDALEMHTSVCSNPDVCIDCGSLFDSDDATIKHNFDTSTFRYDAVSHWYACSDCDVKYLYNMHLSRCDQPNVCVDCGEPCEKVAPHNYDYRYLLFDAVSHWYECEDCEAKGEVETHLAFCNAPGVCLACGVTFTQGDEVSHKFDRYEYDANNHWLVCEYCGVKDNKPYPHYVRCNENDICSTCGAKCDERFIEHYSSDIEFSFDTTHHWKVCIDCGEGYDHELHIGSCATPGVCLYCGQPCSAGGEHKYLHTNMQYDAAEHWYICIDCGQPSDKEAHYSNCKEPNVCFVCRQPYSGSDIAHNVNFTYFEHDAEAHWLFCRDCGDIYESAPHYASCKAPGTCAVCGEECDDTKHIQADMEHPNHDGQNHWYDCLDCGARLDEAPHFATCLNPTVCAICGIDYSGAVTHQTDGTEVYLSNETEHYYECPACGDTFGNQEHSVLCTDKTRCLICEHTVADAPIVIHNTEEQERLKDAYTCWVVCLDCGDATDVQEHMGTCQSDGFCVYGCGTLMETLTHYSDENADIQHDKNNHWWVCRECGENVNQAAHTADENNRSQCAVCGADMPKPAHKHRYSTVKTEEATCDKEGTEWLVCSCGRKIVNKTFPMTEHIYGNANSKMDGTHNFACTLCGNAISESCAFFTAVDGSTTTTACSLCQYVESVVEVVTTADDAIAIVNADAGTVLMLDAPVVLPEPVREALTAMLKKAVPTDISEETALTVTTAPMPNEKAQIVVKTITLNDGTVAKVYIVTLKEKTLTTLRLPISAEEKLTLTQMKLVFISSEGKMTEIEFELIGDEVVFQTTEAGTFVFLPNDATIN